MEADGGVVRMVSVEKLPQGQFNALVSLTDNAGVHGTRNVYTLVDTGRSAEAARQIRTMTSTRVNGKSVVARGLIARRAEESAPFDVAAKSAAMAKK
jgi:lysozyme